VCYLRALKPVVIHQDRAAGAADDQDREAGEPADDQEHEPDEPDRRPGPREPDNDE
jgi:hypothetical protein